MGMIILETLDEIRALPDGSIVRWHSLDKYGGPQWLDVTVNHKKGKAVFTFQRYDGQLEEIKLRQYKPDDQYRYYELRRRGPYEE